MLTELEALAGAKRAIEATDQKLVARLATALQISKENINVAFGNIFNNYVSGVYKRLSSLRTVLTKEQQVEFSSIYVNLRLSGDRGVVEDTQLFESLMGDPRILIQGTGGAGKSMLMRFLALRSVEYPYGKIPFFVELRSLDFSKGRSLAEILFHYLGQHGNEENWRVFSRALAEGLVTVFLDGLDEVPSDDRANAIAAIKSFAATNQRAGIVVSTRPGNNSDTLPEFELYRVLPLTLDQALEVVTKTNADDDLKREFGEKLQNGLFEKHETFLGIPLLVAMMLLTYSSYSDIPDRMSVFYEQAFSTLYALHDTVSKGPYKRVHFAGLAPDNFSKCFETFCYITLSREKYDFLYADILNYLRKSIELSQVETQPELVLKDLEESVCLMLREGVKYIFTHRSFQEYFAAKFALRYGGSNQFKIIDNCIGSQWQHNTVKMLNEIDEIKFRKLWVLPALNEMLDIMDEAKELPLDERLRKFFGGWHVNIHSQEERMRVPSYGLFMNKNNEEERISTLGVALSRISSLTSPYDYLSPRALLPSDENEARECVESFPRSKAPEVFEAYFGEVEFELPKSVSVMFDRQNMEWLQSRGFDVHLDDYRSHVAEIRDAIAAAVARQDELELDLF